MKFFPFLFAIAPLASSATPPDRVWTVTNTNDSGPGSLRQAILDANDSHGRRENLVQFRIGSGPQTITPLTPLPGIFSTTTLDATTQPGFSGTPIIELSGAVARGPVGIVIGASNCVVRGLVINRWLYGMTLASSGNVVEGNYIGTDFTGTNGLGNRRSGVIVAGFGHRIGGVTPQSRNIIAANRDFGIILNAGGSGPTLVQGNFIGTDATGARALANSGGIRLLAANTEIGGTAPGAGNLISGNGIGIQCYASYSNAILGNFIGTDATGLRALPNGSGIVFGACTGNAIGGSEPGAGNVISGNAEFGIFVWTGGFGEHPPFSFPAVPRGVPNLIQGNWIGTDRSGLNVMGNGEGIAVYGEEVINYGPQEIVGNCIYGNAGLGINLAIGNQDGLQPGPADPFAAITPNDPGDSDAGPNGLQNFPRLRRVLAGPTSTEVLGTLNSLPMTEFFVDFYSCVLHHRSFHGEGQFYLGSTRVITDTNGDVVFRFVASGSLLGDYVTAIARNAATGDTSEFSSAVPAHRTP